MPWAESGAGAEARRGSRRGALPSCRAEVATGVDQRCQDPTTHAWQARVPHAVRVSNWAHVTGATTKGRSGVLSLWKKYLSKKDDDGGLMHFPFVAGWSHASRVIPVSQLFHIFWDSVFEFLPDHSVGEGLAVQHVRSEHSTTRIIASDTEAIVSWDAPWRTGCDRVQLGSDCGPAQESWHHQSLVGSISRTHQTPLALYDDLKGFNQSRPNVMENDVSCLHYWPCVGSHLDLHSLQGTALHAEGRSAARDLVDWDGLVASPGQLHVVHVPRHLVEEDTKKNQSKFVPKIVQPISLDDLRHMSQLVDSYRNVAQDLTNVHVIADGRAGGQPRIADWRRCGELFADWCTVEEAESFWKVRDSGAGGRSPHQASRCSFCEEAAGLLVAGLLPSTQLSASSRRKRPSRKAAVRSLPRRRPCQPRCSRPAAFREVRPAQMRRHCGRCSGVWTRSCRASCR